MANSTASSNPFVVDVSKLFSLQGKTAIVTGGTGGLGLAMTAALASAGADIVAIERSGGSDPSALTAAIEACGRSVKHYATDMRDSKALRECFRQIWTDGVKADILLNCAGIQKRGDAADFKDEDIELVLDVNLTATIVCCQEFAKPLLAEGRPGKIINVASIMSFVGGYNIMPYAATKGGVLQATKAFSNEWAGKGIQCNCIHPGYFHTALTEQLGADAKYSEFDHDLMVRTPAKRWGAPEDLQGAVIFLASAASKHISGSSITIDGGYMGA